MALSIIIAFRAGWDFMSASWRKSWDTAQDALPIVV